MVRLAKIHALLLLALLWSAANPARAHFTLLKPTSWLKEDSVGGPQKGSPCGPGNTTPLLGDDVQPIPVSGMVNTFHAGETIDVAVNETIHHPGYFRISIGETAAKDATTMLFPNPPVDDPTQCSLNLDAVPTGAHDNVLADGLWKDTDMAGNNRMLMTQVTLPNKPCDSCTLQVVMVMMDHGLSSCYYFHCADLKILPADGSAGTSGSAGASGGTGAAGASGSGAAGAAGATGATAGTGGMQTSTGGTTVGSAGTTVTGTAGTSPSGGSTGSTPVNSGSGGATAATGSSGAPVQGAVAGTGAVTSAPTSSKKSGCNVSGADAVRSGFVSWLALAFTLFSLRARRRSQARGRNASHTA